MEGWWWWGGGGVRRCMGGGGGQFTADNRALPNPPGLCIKTRLSTQPLIWKLFSFSCK